MNITSPVSVVDELERYEPEQYVGLHSPTTKRWLLHTKGESAWLYLAEKERGSELLAFANARPYLPGCSDDYQPHLITLNEALDVCRKRKVTRNGKCVVGIRFPLTGEVIPL